MWKKLLLVQILIWEGLASMQIGQMNCMEY